MRAFIKPNLAALAMVIMFAAVYRVLPHPPNITPVFAMALFAGAYFKQRLLAIIVPISVMLLSDWVLGWHSSILFVYAAMALTAIIGFSLRAKQSASNIGIAALGATASFFLISNFGVWLTSGFYPQTISGLISCYLAGVPFLQYSIIGNAIFCLLFFGGFKLYQQRAHTQLVAQ